MSAILSDSEASSPPCIAAMLIANDPSLSLRMTKLHLDLTGRVTG
ncbi:hypothetical protein [Mucilaginibacter oryzae]|nr:hypothetical protein [Mucilaginibacter oryzae]